MFTDDRVYFLCIATYRESLKTSPEILKFIPVTLSSAPSPDEKMWLYIRLVKVPNIRQISPIIA